MRKLGVLGVLGLLLGPRFLKWVREADRLAAEVAEQYGTRSEPVT
jgi:type II secretory pathway pseudopilin PulG